MVKKGDTLVEVALAVGILSMIAISITAVISGSTSGAQTALETTLTREEVDAQSEALRFIQDSYVTNKNTTESNKFDDLWAAIADAAYDPKNVAGGVSADDLNAILKFNPGTCQNIYNNNFIKEHAFVINPRQLSAYINGESGVDADDVVVRSKNSTKFIAAPIFPRLTFGTALNNSSSDDLMDNTDSRNLYKAEGIFVIAVKDDGHTAIVDENSASGAVKKEQAFYDFYIHTCWYGANANEPSTVSTVIRLYDPGSVTSLSGRDQRIMVSYYENIVDLSMGKEAVISEQSSTSGNYTFRTCDEVLGGRPGVDCSKFRGWRNSRDGVIHLPGEIITGSGSENRYFKVSAAWQDKHYIVYFNNNSEMHGVCAYPESGAIQRNGGTTTIYTLNTFKNTSLGCTDRSKFVKPGYDLTKWNTKPRETDSGNEQYDPGATLNNNDIDDDILLYARYEPYGIFYNLNGGYVEVGGEEKTEIEPTDCSSGACNITSIVPVRRGYDFLGWCKTLPMNGTCKDTSWGLKHQGDLMTDVVGKVNVYAVWWSNPDTVFLVDSSGSMSSMIRASKLALIKMTSETMSMDGKVALYDYNTDHSGEARMRCGFTDTMYVEKCTSSNISNKINQISGDGGNENLPKALETVLNDLKGQWTEDYLKTILILTDEPISGGRGYMDLDTMFIDKVKEENITPLNIFIVTTHVSDYADDFRNKFDGYEVNVNIISMPNGYTSCRYTNYESESETCRNAIDELLEELSKAI